MENQNLERENLKKEIEELKKQLELTQKKSEEHLNGWKRAKADYINFKKDTEKQNQELIQFANAALIVQILPIFEHFKKALAHIPKEQAESGWVMGIINIKKQFVDFLKKLGVEEIKTVGEKFNPSLHEAASHEEKEGFETDVIFEEVESGYTLYGQLLKPAKVKVAK